MIFRGRLALCALSALALAGALLCPPAWSKPIALFDNAKESKELRRAQRKLKDLERRIKRKEIPPIEFEFDKAILLPSSKQTLELLADIMLEQDHHLLQNDRLPDDQDDLKLMIFGHTCDIGSDEYNQWLSQKRAEAVKDYLMSLGVMGEYIRAKGYGESHPLVPNDSEENRATNRRVEFVLTNRWWHSVF